MKKILIYLHKDELAPVGGPLGYNYNLLLGLKEIEASYQDQIDIVFLPGKSIASGLNSKINTLKSDKIKNFIKAFKSIYRKGRLLYGNKQYASVKLNEYDAIHFHRTIDMYAVKNSLKDYSGKVILTSHTPTMPAKEVYSLLTNFEKDHMKWFYKKLPIIDEYAFNRADYIIFPCSEAEEPYYYEWPNYSEIREKNKDKYHYITTGTEKKVATSTKEQIRRQYGIPNEAFVISYVGRHNEIKGYGDLKEIGSKLLNMYPDIYFLIAGKEGPLFKLAHSNWIEIGWTNDPSSIINASDLFILPNRETYFDLVMLEVISLGQIILAKNTGGNKYFSKYRETGIILYNNNEDAIQEIKKIIETSERDRQKCRNSNTDIFQKYFTNKVFAEKYISLLREVI